MDYKASEEAKLTEFTETNSTSSTASTAPLTAFEISAEKDR